LLLGQINQSICPLINSHALLVKSHVADEIFMLVTKIPVLVGKNMTKSCKN